MRPHLGISRAVEQISQVFLKLGHSVCILAEGPLYQVSKIGSQLTVISLPSDRHRFKSMILLGVPHPVSSWLSTTKEYLPQGRIVVSPVVGLQSLIFKKSHSANYLKVITLYTPYSKYSPLGILYFVLQRKSLAFADIVVGNSKTILDKFKVSESNRVRVIPNFNSLPISPASKTDLLKYDFIWIGSLTLRKGVDRLLHFLIINRGAKSVQVIWSKSRFSFFPLLILRILEEKGWCKTQSAISDDELSTLIADSKALLSTTRFESFGMTLVEAASHGKGTIGIRAPGVLETLPEISAGAIYFKKISEVSKYLKSINFDETTRLLGSNAKRFNSLKYNKALISLLWNNLPISHETLASPE